MSGQDEIEDELIEWEQEPSTVEDLLEKMPAHVARPIPLTRKRNTKFTQAARERYLSVLARYGVKGIAARVAGVTPATVNTALKEDELFAEMEQEALGLYRDSLELTIKRRAVEGYLEPVIGGKDRNRVVTYVRKYSDRLLELHAKRHIPEYRDKIAIDANVQTGVLAVFGSNLTEAEFEARHAEAAAPALEGEFRVESDE